MTTASDDPKPPPMSEQDHINMAKRALRGASTNGPEVFAEFVGRFSWNIERIADALERSADALSAEPKPLFATADVGKSPA